MTRSSRTLHVVGTKDVHTLIGDMEYEIREALRFGNALALAIEGIGSVSYMETEDEKGALRALAFEVTGAAAKVQERWEELFKLSHSERG
jgi:hypothetical protein